MIRRDLPLRCVTFDLGGTSLRAGRYDPVTESVTRVVREFTPSHRSLPAWSLDELRIQLFTVVEQMSRSLLSGELPDLVGFAFPGPIDPQGNALSVPTVFGNRG